MMLGLGDLPAVSTIATDAQAQAQQAAAFAASGLPASAQGQPGAPMITPGQLNSGGFQVLVQLPGGQYGFTTAAQSLPTGLLASLGINGAMGQDGRTFFTYAQTVAIVNALGGASGTPPAQPTGGWLTQATSIGSVQIPNIAIAGSGLLLLALALAGGK
jgi:hypothetical protein